MKYIIECKTGLNVPDVTYGVDIRHPEDIEDVAYDLAYDNWKDRGGMSESIKDLGYNESEMSEDDWDNVFDNVGSNYSYEIFPFSGTEDEWKMQNIINIDD